MPQRRAQTVRLLRVISVVVSGIEPHVIDHDLAHHAIAAGDPGRKAGEQHQGVDVIGIGLRPHETLHAAHGGADEQAQVIDLQAFAQHQADGADHVPIVIMREFRAEGITGLARFAKSRAELIGQDKVIFGRVEQLVAPKEDARK